MTEYQRTARALRGPRIFKSARGIISCAAIAGAGALIAPGPAVAQAVPLECLPGTKGPTADDMTPYGGGMCGLGSLRADNLGSIFADAVSADGSVAAGSTETDDGSFRAFRWDAVSADMSDLGSLRADNLGSVAV